MSLRALIRALPLLLGVSLTAWAGPRVAAAQDAAKPAREQRAHSTKRARATDTSGSRKKRAREGGARGRRARGAAAAEGASGSAPAETGARAEDTARNTHRPARRAEVSARSESGSNARTDGRTDVEARAGERNDEAARAAAAGVDSQIVKEGDTSVKVMKFEGFGIEGRLKSPQLVYFVERTRAEFDHPTLPHRSFLPELERTTAREPMR